MQLYILIVAKLNLPKFMPSALQVRMVSGVKEERVDVPYPFEANTMVSQIDGCLVFIDLDYEMLIFNPCKNQEARMV
jgi:hypothetical protein